jgi:hypothetical protein
MLSLTAFASGPATSNAQQQPASTAATAPRTKSDDPLSAGSRALKSHTGLKSSGRGTCVCVCVGGAIFGGKDVEMPCAACALGVMPCWLDPML